MTPRDVRALLSWYRRERRDLPWRRTRDPWAILVSEVMLQQTQVARVVPRYLDFLERFPAPEDCASAPPAEVIALWSGLGYNRRALALRSAAAAVARDGWPRDADGLAALPGVGPYTAAAVASFAFGEPAAAVDTNTRRVLSRHDGTEHAGVALRARAQDLIGAAMRSGGAHEDWNQALMELGATACTARRADCGACPLRDCASRGMTVAAARPATPRPRFVDTDRWVRGRVVAALAAGLPLPSEVEPERLERALAGLVRDGLVVREGAAIALPGA